MVGFASPSKKILGVRKMSAKVNLQEVKEYYTGLTVSRAVKDKDGASYYELAGHGEIKSFGNRDFAGRIRILIPDTVVISSDGHEFWPLLNLESYRDSHPYGKEITEHIASSVFHRYWKEHLFGILPGSFWFDGDSVCFRVQSDPTTDGSQTVLFYSNASVKSYPGASALNHFKIDELKLSCLLLPMNYLIDSKVFAGRNIFWLREKMAEGLSQY